MPTIINSFRQPNPLADVLKGLGASMFGDQLTPALKRAQLDAIARKERGLAHLAELARTGAFASAGDAAGASIEGEYGPENLGVINRFLDSQRMDPTDPRITRDFVGTGTPQNSPEFIKQAEANDTARAKYGVDVGAQTSRANNAATIANSYRQFNEEPKPAFQDGNAVFIPQGQLTQPGITAPIPQGSVDPIQKMRQALQVIEAQGKDMSPADKQNTALDFALDRKTSSGMTVYGPDGKPIFQSGGAMKAPTEAQGKDIYFSKNAGEANAGLDQTDVALTEFQSAAAGQLPELVGNYFKSPQYRQAQGYGLAFVNAIERKESGAAIATQEDLKYWRTYMPQPGDDLQTIADKKIRRVHALDALKAGLGPLEILVKTGELRAPPVMPGGIQQTPSGTTSRGTQWQVIQ